MNKTPETINKEYYDAIANDYERYDGMRKNSAWVERIIKNIAAATSGTYFLDVCAGSGFISNIAVKYFKQVIAVDCSEKMLDRITDKRIERIPMSAYSIDLWENKFDCVCCFAGLHHLDNIKRFISAAYTSTASGGVFYSDHDLDCVFYQRYKWLIEARRFVKQFGIPEELWEERLESERHNNGIPSFMLSVYLKQFSAHHVSTHWEGFLPINKTFQIGEAPYLRTIARKG